MIIAGDQLGAVDGLNVQAFNLALTRVTEICIGTVAAGIVFAATDLGGATILADLAAGIVGRCKSS